MSSAFPIVDYLIATTRQTQVRFGFNVCCGVLANCLVGPIIFDGTLTVQRYIEIF